LSISNNILSIDLWTYQKLITCNLPLSISNNTLSIDLSTYQKLITCNLPLSISNNTLSIDLSNYATQSYVNTAINNLIAAAPSSLDTLKELASALNNDANFASTVTNLIGTKQGLLSVSSPLSLSNNSLSINLNAYQLNSDMINYLTISSASSTYQQKIQ
jgi:hypothetical protein